MRASSPSYGPQGYKRFGNVPFVVKQVLKVEAPQNFVSILLGV